MYQYQYHSIFDDPIDLNEMNEYEEISLCSHDDLNPNLFDNPFEKDSKDTWMQDILFQSVDKSEYKNIFFICELLKKQRGRPRLKETKKEKHSSSCHDNIISKIQIHFLNFIIYFINDCINVYFKNEKNRRLYFFKKFEHKFKCKVKNEHLENMKNSTIYDLLNKVNISKKYKSFSGSINIKNLKELNKITFFQKIFEMKFLDLFNIYYNEKQLLRELTLFDRKITFSNRTKTFYDLLQKNKKIEKNIMQMTEMIYLDDIKKMEINQRITDASDEEKFSQL